MSKARDLANAGTALTTVSATELGYLDGVTSAVQTQIDSKIGSASAINPTIVDAKGDIIAATAADTVARLAVGSNDTILTADSSTATGLKWATPAAGGGMTLLSTTTISGTTNITGINQTYKRLVIVGTGIKSSATSQLRIWPRNSSGPTSLQIGSNWFSGNNQANNPIADAIYPDNNNAYISTIYNNNFVFMIDDYAQTTNKPFQIYGMYSRSGVTDPLGFHIFGAMYAATAMNEINFYSDAGLTQGTIKIYGVN